MTIIRRTTVNGKTTTEVIEYKGPTGPVSTEKPIPWVTFLRLGKSKTLHSGYAGVHKERGPFAGTECGRYDLKKWQVLDHFEGPIAAEFKQTSFLDRSNVAWLAERYPDLTPCKYCFFLY